VIWSVTEGEKAGVLVLVLVLMLVLVLVLVWMAEWGEIENAGRF
jgi:hypothetical protein